MNAKSQSPKDAIKGSQRDSNSSVTYSEDEPDLTDEQYKILNAQWSRVENLEEQYKSTRDNKFKYLAEQAETEYFAAQNEFYLKLQNKTMNEKDLEKLKAERDTLKTKVDKKPSEENIKKLGDIVDKINKTEKS